MFLKLTFILDKGYTVSVHLGKVLDPHIKLYLQLCGENEESTKIVLRPTGTGTDSFQEGKTYKFSVEMPDIGKVILNESLLGCNSNKWHGLETAE